jgi:predicted P-loop ATPase
VINLDEEIEKFKADNEIVDIIGNTVILKKEGRNYVGLCPFHNEDSPSFTVSPERQKYKCFGCGESGDVIDFISKVENKTFEDVLGLDNEKKEFVSDFIKTSAKYATKNKIKYDYSDFYIYSTSLENVTSLKVKYTNLAIKDKTFRQYVIDFRREKPVVVAERDFNEEFEIGLYCSSKVERSIKNNKSVYIVEGEKDATTLNKMGYTATTFPRHKINDLNLKQLVGANIILLGDTGKAGELKKKYCKDMLIDSEIKSLKLPILKGLKQMGDNKDVTDWLEVGNGKNEIAAALKLSWDVKKNEKFMLLGQKEIKAGEIKEFPLKVWQNLYSLLLYKDIELSYNVLSRQIKVDGGGLKTDDIDTLVTNVRTICILNGLSLTKGDTWDFLRAISKVNEYNPVLDWLKVCEKNWDGKNRIQELCDTIDGKGDKDYNDKLIVKWLMNAINVITNTGLKNQEGILVLQGGQGSNKTRWIRSIIPEDKEEWLKTGVRIDPSDKDSIAKATSYWIVELGELDATLKKDQSELKQFFTEPVDEYREPYSIASKKFNRLTCFYATVNDKEFLRDPTGNRRYWVIETGRNNVDHNIDLAQLWGEVYILYKSKTISHYMDETELRDLSVKNDSFEVKTSAEIKILDLFCWDVRDLKLWSKMSSTEISNVIGSGDSPTMVGKAMKKLMLKDKDITIDTNGRKYLVPPMLHEREKRDQWSKELNKINFKVVKGK